MYNGDNGNSVVSDVCFPLQKSKSFPSKKENQVILRKMTGETPEVRSDKRRREKREEREEREGSEEREERKEREERDE